MSRLAPLVACLATAAIAHAANPPAAYVDPAVMAKAFPANGSAATADASTKLARDLVLKSLGDDARDLVFIPVTPCTVWDTRFAFDGASAGIIGDGVTKRFFSHHNGPGSDYGTWGGNPSCPETLQSAIGMRPFAAMMTAYVNDATGNGWVTFYRDGDADPSLATISVYYAPGPTRTQTVISKSNRGYGVGLSYDIAVTGRFASAHVSASVVGYFLKPVNIVLPDSTPATGNIVKGGQRFLHNYGTQNTFVGQEAGNFALIGDGNVGLGYRALNDLSAGEGNVAIGANALGAVTTGNGNIGIGASALGGHFTNGNFNIHIGHPGATENFTLRLGTPGAHTRAFVAGIRGVISGVSDAIPVVIDSGNQLATVNSSRAVKDDIADMDRASADLMKLRPVTFHYKQHGSARLQYGLIAEEVEEVYPGLVAKAPDGSTETVMYQFLPPMLLNEVQKQQKRIVELESELASLKAAVAKLQHSR